MQITVETVRPMVHDDEDAAQEIIRTWNRMTTYGINRGVSSCSFNFISKIDPAMFITIRMTGEIIVKDLK